MIFEITDILRNDEVEIKLLTYQPCELNELNLNLFSEIDREHFSNFISNKRKLEFYYTRYLWSQFNAFQEIQYSDSGKPQLKNGFISISHSRNTIVIAFSGDHLVGLDIEYYSPKVLSIRDKFLSPLEQNRFDTTNEKQMTTLWSIKEAVYKLADVQGLNFKENIRIMAVGDINKVILVKDETEKKLIFSRISFSEFILIYCIEETLLS